MNLIGEHTDYSEGLVFPCAIDRSTFVLGAPRVDRRWRVWSRDLSAQAEFDAGSPERRGGWIDYVQGIAFALRERGIAVGGLDIAIASQLPVGSGLSSSAALGVGVVTLVDAALGLALSRRERALVAHRSECDFVGVGCGILDQFASALGERDHALRIDCRSQAVDAVAFPSDALRLLVSHSGVERALAEGGYRERLAECRAACRELEAAGVLPGNGGLGQLRELAPSDLARVARHLPPLLLGRVRHVVSENTRVTGFVAALRARDLAKLGGLLREGQRSLRDDFAVSTPELDCLVESADALPGVLGSRITGAGFGGCALHLVEREAVGEVSVALADAFERRFARRPPVLAVRPEEGASIIAGEA